MTNFPANISPTLVMAAANLNLIPLKLDPYALNEHATGGVVDMEWVDEKDRLVNIGVPVDAQGLESAFPFFEDRIATLLEKKLQETGLETIEARQKYYLDQVKIKPTLQKFLTDTGVDVEYMLKSADYFQTVWQEIKCNRRAAVNVAKELGLEFFGLEAWHIDCNDARGGIRSKRTGIVSGGPSYAVFMGQKQCAWGNASKLWEKL